MKFEIFSDSLDSHRNRNRSNHHVFGFMSRKPSPGTKALCLGSVSTKTPNCGHGFLNLMLYTWFSGWRNIKVCIAVLGKKINFTAWNLKGKILKEKTLKEIYNKRYTFTTLYVKSEFQQRSIKDEKIGFLKKKFLEGTEFIFS